MEPTILSIGNATKDSFLDINQRQVYKDKQNVFHYDLTFDDSTLEYKRRAGILGGVILSEKIFQAAHIKSFSNINPRGLTTFNFEKENYPVLYRYIVSHGARSVILSNSPKKLNWVAPIFVPETVYIADNILSKNYLAAFKNYLKNHPEIRLIFSLEDFNVEVLREFLPRARVVFVDVKKPILGDLIDYSSVETVGKSLRDLGVEISLIENGEEIYAVRDREVIKITTKFQLNSFYQKSIFRASFIGEILNGNILRESLETAVTIAENSDFNAILKPFLAKQILLQNKEERLQVISEEPSREEILREVAQKMLGSGKGIFAADESGGSIAKKFAEVGVDDSTENRRAYREMFLTTPEIEKYLNGVILAEETVEQKSDNGESFLENLKNRGILVGVKLDEGLRDLEGFDGETISAGLDNLAEKLDKYAKLGLNFAKWRVAFKIDKEKNLPSPASIAVNVQTLARYAKMCQIAGIVPIVEPEVIFSGNHSISECKNVTEQVLKALFEELRLFQVDISAVVLKVNMVLAGRDNPLQSSAQEVASSTLEMLERAVPDDIAGVIFLSGGQDSQRATQNLAEIVKKSRLKFPLTFSFARALQDDSLKKWAGKKQNVSSAQTIFFQKLLENSAAVSRK
ncbi:MAG: fructose-bisphosphate aldolase class I [bacterium]|nr:fructose-bisphosphate aldolase class I [bacterium]